MIGLNQNPGYEALKIMLVESEKLIDTLFDHAQNVKDISSNIAADHYVQAMNLLDTSDLLKHAAMEIDKLRQENTEMEMAHQAEENALRNLESAIAENEKLKRRIICFKLLLNTLY